VTAAGELSIEPVEWCFLFAGCVTYRGYFERERAERFADGLRAEGYDVSIGGVAAFSTLGWFADPVLSTFLERSGPELAGLIFHELAHQRVYVKNGTEFNESFATAVEVEGVRRWLQARGLEADLSEYLEARARNAEFVALVLAYRERLAAVYGADRPDGWKRRRKAEVFDELRAEYGRLRESWGGDDRYDGWFGDGLNNARLSSIGAYHGLEPGFRRLLDDLDGDLEAFYAEVGRLSGLPAGERESALRIEPPASPGGERARSAGASTD
jgi:predicted aminopeptidase